MKKSLLLLFALAAFVLQGQTLTERLLWTNQFDPVDFKMNAYGFTFDCDGNYFFLMSIGKDRIVVTNKTTIGELCEAGSRYGSRGDSRFFRSVSIWQLMSGIRQSIITTDR